MRSRSLHPASIAALSTLVLVLLLAIGAFLTAPAASRQGAIAIGVASSLLASSVYATVTSLLIGSRRRELQEDLERVASLSRSVSIVADAEMHCVMAVKSKIAYAEEEWLGLLREANQSLTMIGHALDKWCGGRIESEFCAAIKRVVANGGAVRLLMLADGANRVANQREKRYATRIQRTRRVLERVNGELCGSGTLAAYQLGDGVDMPYMAVCNEHTVITAPYPAKTQNSDRMPALRLSSEGEIAKQLLKDIDALFEDGATKMKL